MTPAPTAAENREENIVPPVRSGGMEIWMKTEKQYKELTIKEFTIAADSYESSHAGIYEMCREDYPYIAGELAKEDYTDLLDCGCGTGPMISLLYEEDPGRH